MLTASRVPKVQRRSATRAACVGQNRPAGTRTASRARAAPQERSERVISCIFLS